MSMLSRVSIALLLAAAACCAWWFSSHDAPTPSPGTEPRRKAAPADLPVADVPASGGTGGTGATVAPAPAASDHGQTHAQSVAARYRLSGNLAALAHGASVSRDPVELHYANLYLTRCFTAGGLTEPLKNGVPGATAMSPAVEAATHEFAEFCGPWLGNSRGFDKNEYYAASQTPSYKDSDRARLQGREGLAAAAAQQDAEWFIELFSTADTMYKLEIVVPAAATVPAKLGPGIYMAMIDAAVRIEACSRWGCDTRYRMASLCLLDPRACKAEEPTAQYVELLAADDDARPVVEAGIRDMRAKLRVWMDSL